MSVSVRTRGYLPHWTKPNSDYFITFRTADSISPETLAALRLTVHTPDEKRKRVERALDRCDRGDILRGLAAESVADSIMFGAKKDYELHAWCVIPNHVHLLLRPKRGQRIALLIQALKSVTAHNVNKLLGRSRPVWEREYFDRIVRPGTFEAVKTTF